MAFAYLFYILFFLFGAFVSSLLMEWRTRHKPQTSYLVPIIIEIVILLTVGLSSFLETEGYFLPSILLSSALLFAMGLQNALVSRVSQSVVRTTHLTGLFTDLGIELSRLFFYKDLSETVQIKKSIRLKLAIISCFFAGCIIGGFVFPYLGIRTLLLSTALLLFALWYDQLLFRYYSLRRKFRDHH